MRESCFAGIDALSKKRFLLERESGRGLDFRAHMMLRSKFFLHANYIAIVQNNTECMERR